VVLALVEFLILGIVYDIFRFHFVSSLMSNIADTVMGWVTGNDVSPRLVVSFAIAQVDHVIKEDTRDSLRSSTKLIQDLERPGRSLNVLDHLR
jgi:hypothetical protein